MFLFVSIHILLFLISKNSILLHKGQKNLYQFISCIDVSMEITWQSFISFSFMIYEFLVRIINFSPEILFCFNPTVINLNL